MRWTLDDYYPSFESSEFMEDIKKLENLITLIENIELPPKVDMPVAERAVLAEKVLRRRAELSELVGRLMSFCSLTLSVETANKTALSYQQKFQQMLLKLTKPSVRFQIWLAEGDDLQQLLQHSDYLKEISFYLEETVKYSQYLLSEQEENILSRLSLTGSNAWTRMKGYIESQHMVELDVDGKKEMHPLPVIRNFAYDNDADLRKKAYLAEIASYDQIAYPVNSALNAIKGEVIQKVELRGYESVLEMTLLDSNMEKRTLDTMLNVIKEYLPEFRKYLRHKAKLLGYENGLPFYDLFAPMGNIDKKYTFTEARQFVVKNFRRFSDRLADFAEHAFANNWIDAEPRQGKRGGAFCSTCHAIQQSRVLANFTGGLGNVTTLAHELGHAYHGFCLKDELLQNTHYSMPVAETASIFAETIVKDAITQNAEGDARLAILETKLMESTQVIVDIYSRYLFESNFIAERKDGDVNLERTRELMLQAQKDAYGDGLDPQFLHPYMWLCKPHYYYSGANFYNFPYAFGQLFATGLYAIYLKDKDSFVKKYDDILRETGRNDITGVAAFAGIDINDKEFWQGSLDLIKAEVEEYLKF
ncbi:MAG: M3 family oligoendopeptidase [Candidatus Stygibacter frigidus]|nr:M3 family oligoendopeptidase [Candidatus Stygibacter frigidus]